MKEYYIKCQNCLENNRSIFCDNCDNFINPNWQINPFTLFHCKKEFDIDLLALEDYYRELQKLTHFDAMPADSQEKAKIAMVWSEITNKFYTMLKNPYYRGLILLNRDLEEHITISDHKILNQVLEYQQALTNNKRPKF